MKIKAQYSKTDIRYFTSTNLGDACSLGSELLQQGALSVVIMCSPTFEMHRRQGSANWSHFFM